MKLKSVNPSLNGTLKTTVRALNDDNSLLPFSDRINLDDNSEVERLRRNLKKKFSELCAAYLEENPSYFDYLVDALHLEVQQQAANHTNRAEDEQEENEAPKKMPIRLLDKAPAILDRPLSLVAGKAYAASWLWAEVFKGDSSTPVQERTLFIITESGELISTDEHESLGIQVKLPDMPPESKLWSIDGTKAYLEGIRPNYADVFHRVTSSYDYFMDFGSSFAPQSEMCELSACFSLATWLTPAFNVIGYPWPNGEPGSGKTKWGACWAETSYLGMIVLTSGSYAALRDLAHYGAALLFDDAETMADPKRSDPDKRALFLAGNRRGAQVAIKEPAADGRGWQTRWINAFCPRSFTAIALPDAVLGSRSIRIPLVRTANKKKANISPENHDCWPCDYYQLQNDLWATGLTLIREAATIDRELNHETDLAGREFEPWRAVLATARLFERRGVEGLEGRIRKTMHAYQQEKADGYNQERAVQVLKVSSQYFGVT